MLSHFTKNFHPTTLSHSDLILEITKITPHIISLSNEEQISLWEFIATSVSNEQQQLITMSVDHLLHTDMQKQNYAQGITLFSIDYIALNQSLESLKNIVQPDSLILSTITVMEELKNTLDNQRQYKKIKM